MPRELVITGMGVISPIGQGKADFAKALLAGNSAFDVMRRPGRQQKSAYLGAEIGDITFPAGLEKRFLRASSLSAQLALVALHEAWDEARLHEIDPRRIGLVIGGSNTQQRELLQLQKAHQDRPEFLRPSYGLSFMDTDLCGFCTAQFGIRGLAFTVGGASASGQLAIVQAAQAVVSGQVDICVALGALTDLSYWECQGFRALGAMGSDRYADEPELACRPFDREHDGFIFGESCGALVIETRRSSERRSVDPYASLCGWGIAMDANRNPDPSRDGEVRAINDALRAAGQQPSEIDYVNPHGTGSPLGDETELSALAQCGLAGVHINATKSLIGHGLSAAGAVEAIATLLQMKEGRLHPSRNLGHPVDPDFSWITDTAVDCEIAKALTLSMGFGGMNTALIWRNCRSL